MEMNLLITMNFSEKDTTAFMLMQEQSIFSFCWIMLGRKRF